MSDTPRTDAVRSAHGPFAGAAWFEMFDHARTLERELNAAHDLLRQADDEIKALKADNVRLLTLATEATSAT